MIVKAVVATREAAQEAAVPQPKQTTVNIGTMRVALDLMQVIAQVQLPLFEHMQLNIRKAEWCGNLE